MQLAADFERLRQARGLSVNAISKYSGIDRNTLARLKDAGTPPRLDLLERLARYMGADVAQWRAWAGYGATPSGLTPAQERLLAGLAALREQYGQFFLSLGVGMDDAGELTEEAVTLLLDLIREALEQRAHEKGPPRTTRGDARKKAGD